jgi:hypothetical protein
MFAKVVNGVVAEWPIPSLAPLFPNTSFPSPMTEASMPEGYVMVGVIPQPTPGPNQKVVPGGPVQQDGKWVQSWTVLDMEPWEIAERDTARANDVRARRNDLLAASDWTQVADAPVDKAAWAAYRQALRDVTSQASFPLQVTWPQMPS